MDTLTGRNILPALKYPGVYRADDYGYVVAIAEMRRTRAIRRLSHIVALQ
jgi:hypothetical protein